MSVSATVTALRIAPRKIRLVIDAVRGLPVVRAEHTLRFMKKRGATPVLKLLQSAIANAVHNQKLSKEQLMVYRVTANEGPTIKRLRARAFGRAATIRKRTSHIRIELRELRVVPKIAPAPASTAAPAPKSSKPASLSTQ